MKIRTVTMIYFYSQISPIEYEISDKSQTIEGLKNNLQANSLAPGGVGSGAGV